MDSAIGPGQTSGVGVNFRLVASLEESLPALISRLREASEQDDLFATQHVIVPTAGVRAWLLGRLADEFGVAANIDVGYLGKLNRFLDPTRRVDDDPWSIERVTSVLLDVFETSDGASYSPYVTSLVDNQGGRLPAARYLADRFDRYAARRPQMIVSWDRGVPALATEASGPSADASAPALHDAHLPQFELWREVPSRIATAPWPGVAEAMFDAIMRGETPVGVPSRLHVIGLQ